MRPLGSAYVLPFLVCAELMAKRENAKRLLLYSMGDTGRSAAGRGRAAVGAAIGNYFVCPLFTPHFQLDLLCDI